MRKIGFPFLMVVLIGLDQFVKAWTVANIELDTVTEFIPGLMSLAYLRIMVLPGRFYKISSGFSR